MSGITVTFAGLMLICFTGDENNYCTTSTKGNRAWILQASGDEDWEGRRPCGWDSLGDNRTKLVVRVKSCKCDNKLTGIDCKNDDEGCVYTFAEANICVTVDGPPVPSNKFGEHLNDLLSLDKIDPRFRKIRIDQLGGRYAPYSISFPKACLSASNWWTYEPKLAKPVPTKWYSSSNIEKTFYLSDRLMAYYPDAKKVTIGICGKKDGLDFLPGSEPLIMNEAEKLSVSLVGVNKWSLPYLLWYYRLADWNTISGLCPDASSLLRCDGGGVTNCYGTTDAKTTFWPVLLPARPK